MPAHLGKPALREQAEARKEVEVPVGGMGPYEIQRLAPARQHGPRLTRYPAQRHPLNSPLHRHACCYQLILALCQQLGADKKTTKITISFGLIKPLVKGSYLLLKLMLSRKSPAEPSCFFARPSPRGLPGPAGDLQQNCTGLSQMSSCQSTSVRESATQQPP